jgi:hypothetical protein
MPWFELAAVVTMLLGWTIRRLDSKVGGWRVVVAEQGLLDGGVEIVDGCLRSCGA